MRGRVSTILIFALSVVWAAAAVKAEPCSRDKSRDCLKLPATINFGSVPEISKQIVSQEKPEQLHRVPGCNRDGEDDPSGSGLSDGAKRGARGAAGGDPVIDDDDRPAGKRRGRLVAEIDPPAPLDLA